MRRSATVSPSGGKSTTKSKSKKTTEPGKHAKVFEEDEADSHSSPGKGEKSNEVHARR